MSIIVLLSSINFIPCSLEAHYTLHKSYLKKENNLQVIICEIICGSWKKELEYTSTPWGQGNQVTCTCIKTSTTRGPGSHLTLNPSLHATTLNMSKQLQMEN